MNNKYVILLFLYISLRHYYLSGEMKRQNVNTSLVKIVVSVNNQDLLFRNVKSRDSF